MVTMIIVAIIAVPFALVGVTSIFQTGARQTDAASVNGHDISSLELARGVALRREQIIEQLGENADPQLYEDERIRPVVLKDLIQQKLFIDVLLDNGMGINNIELKEQIAQMSTFQVESQFSYELFDRFLISQGHTSKSFLNELGEQQLRQTFIAAMQTSGFATKMELENTEALMGELRNFTYMRLPIKNALKEVAVTKEEIFQYFEENQQSFRVPEKISIDYIEFGIDSIASSIKVSNAQIKARYELKKSEPQTSQSEVAHIFVAYKDDNSHQSKIDDIQNRLNNGGEFTSLVTEFSEDTGSVASSGNLGFTDGTVFSDSFESAVASLKIGQVSEVVQTDSGFHFIKLLSKEASLGTFDEEKLVIKQKLVDELAEQKYVETLERVNEIAFASDNIKETVEALASTIELDIKQSTMFSRQGGDSIAQYPQIVGAAFSEEVYKDNLNSKVIEYTDSASNIKKAVVLSLNSIEEAHIPSLESLSESIMLTVKQQKAEDKLKVEAQALAKEITDGGDIEQIAQSKNLDWQVQLDVNRSNDAVNGSLSRYAFSITDKSLPKTQVFTDVNGDQIVLRLDSKVKGTFENYSEEQQSSAAKQVGQSAAFQELVAYQDYLFEIADIDSSISIDAVNN